MPQRSRKQARLAEDGILNRYPERVRASQFYDSPFFDPCDLVQVKYEMLRQVSHEGTSKAEAAALYGLSRPTYYQAEAAFAREGLSGLLPRRRGPKGAHKLTGEVMAFIEAQREVKPAPSARALARAVQSELGLSVHPRSIERALVRKKKR